MTVVLELDAVAPDHAAGLCGTAVLTDWLTALGIDPDHCRSLRVLADWDGTVEAVHYETDAAGRHHLNAERTGVACYRSTRPLTSPIPAAVLAAVAARDL